MFPPSFDYYRADDVPEALQLLAEHADDEPAVLAGGHSLVPDAKAGRASPGVVVDVSRIPSLSGVDRTDGRVRVGATTTYSELVGNDDLRAAAPVLVAAAREVGDVQIRNRGTIGGNLARAHPAADLPAAAVAADATVHLRGPAGSRSVPAAEFVLGAGDSDVGPSELVTAVSAPVATDAGDAYVRKTHPATGYAMVGVAARVRVDDGAIADARVAANGATAGAPRLTPVEEALVGEDPGDVDIADVASRSGEGIDHDDLRSDVEASGEFRAHLLAEYAERAVETALQRAIPAQRTRRD